jgi:hypothetical protein
MITYSKAITAIAVSVALLALTPLDAQAKRIKCWDNKDGVRECGYAVPPEYAQKEHEELNKQGTVVKEFDRAKTPEEIAQERAEKERIAKEQAEKKRLAREQAARDRVLLDTFTTEEDLNLARKGKLQAIDTRVKHAEKLVEKLENSLSKMEDEAALLERSGKPVPERMQKDIAGVQRQIEDNKVFIEERRKEKEEVHVKFDADLTRYRELKADGRR